VAKAFSFFLWDEGILIFSPADGNKYFYGIKADGKIFPLFQLNQVAINFHFFSKSKWK